MSILKQSTAATIKLGPFVDDGDGKSAETGLTISQADIRLSKNGGDIAQSHNAAGATHDELGYYNVPLDATDTDTLGRLRVAVSESGALPVWQDFIVVTANVFDSLFSTDKLDCAVVEIATDALTAAAVKADAVTKIQNGLATPTNITAGTITTLTNAPTGMALEATLTAIKGAGWTDETLAALMTAIEAISAGSGATAAEVWAYAFRTLTGFTTTEFNVIGPVRNDGKIEALAGDDYYAADGRAMSWKDTSWPDLTGATVKFISGSTEITMTVTNPGSGVEQTLSMDVPAATSTAMKGEFKFILQATLTNGHVATLLEGEGTFK